MSEDQRVQRGQRLSSALKAQTINTLFDAARAYRLGKLGPQGGEGPDAPLSDGLTVLVQNNTGEGADEGDILAITGAAIDFEELPLEFLGRPVLTGGVPTSPANLIAVLLDGCEDGELVPGVMMGLATITLNVVSTSDACAAPIPGDSTKMQSGSAGHPIIETATRYAGTAETGEQEAVVLLAPGCASTASVGGCPCVLDTSAQYCVTFANVSGCAAMNGLKVSLTYGAFPDGSGSSWWGWLPGVVPRTAIYLYCVDSSGFQLRSFYEYASGGGFATAPGSVSSGYATSYTCSPISITWGAFSIAVTGASEGSGWTCASRPATVSATLAAGACTGTGTGIGGGCSPSCSVLTATGNGSITTGPYTISGVTVGGPALLMLSVATIATVASGGSPVSGVTYNGVAMTGGVSASADISTIAHIALSQWFLYVVFPTTANIVITYSGSAEVLVVAIELLGLTNHTNDQSHQGSAVFGGAPDTGTTSATTVACEYAAAAVASVDPTGGPVFSNGFSNVAVAVAAGAWGATIKLFEGYDVLFSTQTVRATMTGGATGWVALVETYS